MVKKYLLIYNPASGKRKFYKKISFILKYFSKKGISLNMYQSKKAGDLEAKAYEFASKYDVFIISGGDGTINEVINGIMKSEKKPAIGIFPSGTANDIAYIFGMCRNIKRVLDNITNSNPVLMDLNMINDRYFVYVTAAGFLTRISYDISREKVKKLGYIAYLIEGFKDFPKNYEINFKITYDEGIIEDKFMLVFALAANRVGRFTLKNFGNSKLDDGKLELRLIKSRKRFKILSLLKLYLKSGKCSKNEVHLESSKYKIEIDKNLVWNTDGEKNISGSVEIKVVPKAISVFVSKKQKKRFFSSNN